MRRSTRVCAILVLLGLGLGGCMPLGLPDGALALASDPIDPVAVGKRRFRAGDFGLAEESFRRAVETTPGNPEAWLGLAAAHDQLGRFDLSDKDYARLEPLLSRSAAFWNNRGYSYLLRGERLRARRDLERALSLDPENAGIRENLSRLRG